MDLERDNAQRFNAIASTWDSDPQRVMMGQKVARAMLAALAPTGRERALEFGAGTGLLTMLVAGRVASVTALDGSAGMLSVLRDKCARKHRDNVTLIEGTVPDALPAGEFDLIYSSMTLHHVADVEALLRILATHVAPGGRIALADLDSEDGHFHREATGVAHHGFERDVFGRWLASAGFADVEFSTAFTLQREGDDGARRTYPIFLAVARKPVA